MKRILPCLCLLALIVPAAAQKTAKFPIAEGANIRILDDNIWDYSLDTIPSAWQKLGVDCRDFVRAPQFARLITDYMPDVFTLQEYSSHMHAEFNPLVEKEGYAITTTGDGDHWNNTPIFYRPDLLKLIETEYVLYTPSTWSNHGSKSFTSAVFERISDGARFALIGTHLWWKGDKAQAGSTQARAAQVRLMIAQAEVILAKYGNIPLFIAGDMNCEENTIPMQQFIQEGYVPCYKAATTYGDRHNGHHICSPKDGFSVKSRRKGEERAVGAIDHCFILDREGKAEVKVFDCIMEAYTVPLTDHYPNIIDFRL